MNFSVTEPAHGICDAGGSETELVGNQCHLCTRRHLKQKYVRLGGAMLTVSGLIVNVMMWREKL